MAIYLEGLLWYLFLLDCLVYNIMCWSKGKWHHQETHWLSDYFPLHRFWGLFYLFLVLWTGFALYRMQLIVFW
ncbi:hypothetical protein HZC30_04935 [Candidatus Woesearchaeota archaeon]|nr:hypothetical protein [Candidatus Woesearchaeota archaeon]